MINSKKFHVDESVRNLKIRTPFLYSLALSLTAALFGAPAYANMCDITFDSSSNGQTVNGTSASETICLTGNSIVLYSQEGNDIVTDSGTGNTIYLGPGDDEYATGNSNGTSTIYGDAGNDDIDAGGGIDVINGGDGNDALDGGGGNDSLVGGDGNDTLTGGIGGDTEYGGIGNDRLDGDDGSDWLYGESGDDYLDGGADPDDIDGGPGINDCHFTIIDNVRQNCDTSAPELTALSMSRTTVDTSAAKQTIVVGATLTDNLAGLEDTVNGSVSQIRFSHIATGQFIDVVLPFASRISGTTKSARFSVTLTIPRYSAQGAWVLTQALLVDNIGNLKQMTKADVAALGFPTEFQQVGRGDPYGPNLAALSMSSRSVNSNSKAQKITVTARVTDDNTGIGCPGYSCMVSYIRFTHSASKQFIDAYFEPRTRKSGSKTNGIYSSTMTIPRYSAKGVWVAEVSLIDVAGNTRRYSVAQLNSKGFPSSFTQTGAGDADNPKLSSILANVSSVNTSKAAKTITFSIRATDDYIGIAGQDNATGFSQIILQHSTTSQRVFATIDPDRRVSGTPKNGLYKVTVTLPRYSAMGNWEITVWLNDHLGNRTIYQSTDLVRLGFVSKIRNG